MTGQAGGGQGGRQLGGGHSPTELRRLRARVEELQHQLAEQRRFRSHVARQVSHDLRGSLTAITGLVEVLRENGVPRDLASDYLGRIHRQCRLLAVAVADLQHLAEPQLQLVVQVADVQVESLLSDVDELVPDLEVRCDGADGLSVRGDAQRLEQALWNLLHNVVRHGAPPATVTVAARPGDVVEVVVRDAGPGLGEEAAARAFAGGAHQDRFPTGLWLVGAVMRAQGGSASVVRDPDGRRFPVLVLPAGTGRPPALLSTPPGSAAGQE